MGQTQEALPCPPVLGLTGDEVEHLVRGRNLPSLRATCSPMGWATASIASVRLHARPQEREGGMEHQAWCGRALPSHRSAAVDIC